jgi:hypothetical protein
MSTRIPKLWHSSTNGTIDENNSSSSSRSNVANSKNSPDEVTEAYCAMKEERRLYGWRVKVSPLHWYRWWVVVNRMGYKVS